jgi:hypothetical protein
MNVLLDLIFLRSLVRFKFLIFLADGTHKCIKSYSKCSPSLCNFKGSCEIKTDKGKSIPTCNCSPLYSGTRCNHCKNLEMQFPGCHTPITHELVSESMQGSIARYQSVANEKLKQRCSNAIPPSIDTFEEVKYNGEARISGVYSLSDINNQIDIGRIGKTNKQYVNCLSNNVSIH